MAQLIDWKEDYALGIAAVDHEHREMIGLINELYAALGAGADKDELGAFLGEIYARISAHFALEERLMSELQFPAYPEHKCDHERLLDEILDIADECDSGAGFDREDFAARLDRWFSVHFKTHDAQLHQIVS